MYIDNNKTNFKLWHFALGILKRWSQYVIYVIVLENEHLTVHGEFVCKVYLK